MSIYGSAKTLIGCLKETVLTTFSFWQDLHNIFKGYGYGYGSREGNSSRFCQKALVALRIPPVTGGMSLKVYIYITPLCGPYAGII